MLSKLLRLFSKPDASEAPYKAPPPVVPLDERVDSLAEHAYPGHGVVYLRDTAQTEFMIDGRFIGDPQLGPSGAIVGAFTGYYAVPPGEHSIFARRPKQDVVGKFVIKGDDVVGLRLDWKAKAWFPVDAPIKALRDLFLRQELRLWPLATLVVYQPAVAMTVNGVPVPVEGDVLALTNLMPGKYDISDGTRTLTVSFAEGRSELVAWKNGSPVIETDTLVPNRVKSCLLQKGVAGILRADGLGILPKPSGRSKPTL